MIGFTQVVKDRQVKKAQKAYDQAVSIRDSHTSRIEEAYALIKEHEADGSALVKENDRAVSVAKKDLDWIKAAPVH